MKDVYYHIKKEKNIFTKRKKYNISLKILKQLKTLIIFKLLTPLG